MIACIGIEQCRALGGFPLGLCLTSFLVCSDEVWKEALLDAAETGERDIMVRYLLNSDDISKILSPEVWLLDCISFDLFTPLLFYLGCL